MWCFSGIGEKISLSDLIDPIQKASSLAHVKRQLNKVNQTKSEELPLSKEETQRARTPLELEVFNILHKNKQPITNPLLTPVEEAALKAMSVEEAKLRRAELQKARVLQSFYESKARREKKIKSKKYHRLLKKSKQKAALKAFEELKKTNPEAALEELQKLERSRMEERMTLKHQNKGKWAKSKAIMAKYDESARKAMQEQLEQNKELTRKIEIVSSSEDNEDAEDEIIPAFVNDAQMNLEGPNPWMTGKLSSEAKDSGNEAAVTDTQPSQLITDNPDEQDVKIDSEEDLSEEEEEVLLQEFEEKRRLRKAEEVEDSNKPMTSEKLCDAEADIGEDQVSQFNHLFQRLLEQNKETKSTASPQRGDDESSESENEEGEEDPLLTERLERKQTLEEVSALGGEEWEDEPIQQKVQSCKKKAPKEATQPNKSEQAGKPKLIDNSEVLPVKAQRIKIPLLPTTVEEEEEEDGDVDQKMIIHEAFAGDDVIRDFLTEKRSAEDAGKPKDINLVLPGWGEWGGTNLKVSKKKRRKFIIKAPPAPPRKDQRLPNVIINEKKNIMVAAHQVNELPFPFCTKNQFESTIRAPIGNTWNTQRSVQKMTAPRLITKKGHIIKPITEEVFQKNTTTKKPEVELFKPKPQSKHHPHKGQKRKKQAP
ncbi:LOW QUALITY PROTEIN: U3 small nucleolar RNA-associated protein 14 homolog A-like [Bombina bombina]|uniref:LOW QUALITY PROTEIN: U3 small nucleolar RNA-associated protein 14 homolog A-like n=1 Tax=Bombina bombina TaxID=8345 RepID=UPI00235B2C75|nr:LOW QUALITY PROTEIN: U3 small nucleolar RNA-associated protein 14 homolog A-like [Bombina bombina]